MTLLCSVSGISEHSLQRISACPGQTEQFSCSSSGSVNWNIYCPGQLLMGRPQFSRAVDISRNRSEGTLMCTSGDSEVVIVHVALTYESYRDRGESNITVSVMDSNYSIFGIKSLTLECNDDSINRRYLDLLGLP